MARRKCNRERVLGPYAERYGWRIVHVTAGGERATQFFATEKEARRAVAGLQRELGEAPEKTIDDALTAYEAYMRDEKGNKPLSIDQTKRKLRRFFPDLEL